MSTDREAYGYVHLKAWRQWEAHCTAARDQDLPLFADWRVNDIRWTRDRSRATCPRCNRRKRITLRKERRP